MTFYNYRNEDELVNGSDRTRQNPWFVNTGHVITNTPVDEIVLGNYEYYQQHKTLVNDMFFFYDFRDRNSTRTSVSDSISGTTGALTYSGGDLVSANLYSGGIPTGGGWEFDQTVWNEASARFNDQQFFDNIQEGNSWSLGFWLQINSDYTLIEFAVLSMDSDYTAVPNFVVYAKGGLLRFLWTDGAGRTKYVGFPIVDGNLHRYVLTYNGSDTSSTDLNKMKLYYDGVYNMSATAYDVFLAPVYLDTFYVGTGGDAGYNFLVGDLVLWNRELKAEEIAVDYNDGNGLRWHPVVFDLNPSSVIRHSSEYDNFASEATRGQYDDIVINRFDAPGSYKTSGGFLDKESLSISANNALPWRNLSERQELTDSEDLESQLYAIPSSDSDFAWLSQVSVP